MAKTNKVRRDVLRAYSGREWSLKNPKPEQFHIVDIARGLSQENRFTGQTAPALSVAAHSLIVEAIVHSRGGTVEECLWALLHDSAEAYLGDLPSPVKKACRSYQRLEKKVLTSILTKYKLKNKMPKIVKVADDEALEWERLNYFGQHAITTDRNSVWEIRARFLNRFRHLYEQHFFAEKRRLERKGKEGFSEEEF